MAVRKIEDRNPWRGCSLTAPHSIEARKRQMVELSHRRAIGQPADTGLAVTALGSAKPPQPDSHRAERRSHLMKPPVIDTTRLTKQKIRTPIPVIFRLLVNHRLL
jgi:hypothetical protein